MNALVESLILMVAGLLVCWLSPSAARVQRVFWWVGIVVAVCGLLLLLARIILFAAEFLKQALGAR